MSSPSFALTPVWLAQLATSTKSFRDNPILGNAALNRRGLHTARVRAAHKVAALRRQRLGRMVAAADREAFARDGFVIRRDFLSPRDHEELLEQVISYRGRVMETLEGDTLMRKIAIDQRTLSMMPALHSLVGNPTWRNLLAYVGALDAAPRAFIKSIHRRVRPSGVDPQSLLHADTFHPTVKAWLFLSDVPEDGGPFTYVPGSHRLTPERLAWEQRMSLAARASGDEDTAHGSFRVDPAELEAMGLPAPRPLAVPANTLVVADTFGFHQRGASPAASKRLAIWALGPRSPFLPWHRVDWSVAAVGRTGPTTSWSSHDDRSPLDDAELAAPV